jgi:hypothetical protein
MTPGKRLLIPLSSRMGSGTTQYKTQAGFCLD